MSRAEDARLRRERVAKKAFFCYDECMKIFAISDLHLSTVTEKPMDIFGANWENYLENIEEDWRARVGEEDLVLLAGDFSWGMTTEEALPDFRRIAALPGKKVMCRGNHDYWWKSIKKLRESVPSGFFLLQNDCMRFDDVLVCGTRGWTVDERNGEEDKKIFAREVERLKLSLKAMQDMRREEDRVILLTHYPPFNVRRCDSEMTTLAREASVDAVVYGHLHGKDARCDLLLFKDNIPYYLTSCDQLGHRLREIDLFRQK